MHITYFPFVDVMTGALDYNQALDLQISNNEKDTPDFVRLEMLVDLYFPELTTQRDALFNARDQVNKIHADHKTQYKKGDLDGRKFVEPMMNALMLVEERGDSFSEAVAMLGKRE